MRVPREGWQPAGWTPPKEGTVGKSVDYKTVLTTPQFYLLWTAVFGNAVSGMAILATGKTMMTEVFSVLAPTVVTGAFTTSYVASLSMANASGRFSWAVISDYLGR